MIMYKKLPRFSFYCGDATNPFYPDRYKEAFEAFESIKKMISAKSLTFLQQVHGTQGRVVEPCTGIDLFSFQGDFLCTNKPGMALGVMTADCLPILLYDAKNHACAAIHAGWRGSVQGIIDKTLNMMHKYFGTVPCFVEAHFCPSARVCCYQVGEDLLNVFNNSDALRSYAAKVFERREGKIFFDNVALNIMMLGHAGVLSSNIFLVCNRCTICDAHYHSFRRNGTNAGRQATVIVLR